MKSTDAAQYPRTRRRSHSGADRRPATAVAQETGSVYVVHGIPETPGYVDGKRAATLDGHKLDHVEFIVRSRHQPHTIYITGTRVPGGPPARSSFVVQELAPP